MEKICKNCKHKNGTICVTSEPCDSYSQWIPKQTGTTEAAKHYQISDKQPIEIMQSDMTPEQFIGFLRGNVIKYILRMGHKDEPIKEAEKACQYSEWLVKALRGERIIPGGKQ